MIKFDNAKRIPLSGSDNGRFEGNVSLENFSCSRMSVLSDDGASGLAYIGYSSDYYGKENPVDAKLIIKECYPIEVADQLVRNEDVLSLKDDAPDEAAAVFSEYATRYREAFANHAKLYQGDAREQIVVPSKVCDANGTTYLVSDASNGDVMSVAFERMETADQVRAIIKTAEAITAIHHDGYVYLDLKPDNILCIKNSDDSSGDVYTGDIKLFDFDTATPIAALSDASTMISGSGDWSAHEQTHPGYRDSVGTQSDIYSLGALLFWVAIGRPPKSNEVIYASGNWDVSSRDCSNLDFRAANEQAFRCLRKILNSTLTVESELRYKTTRLLIDDLSLLHELLTPVRATHSRDHADMMAKLEELTALVGKLDSSSGFKKPTRDAADKKKSKKGSSVKHANVLKESQKETGYMAETMEFAEEPVDDEEDYAPEEVLDDSFYLRGYEAAQILKLVEEDDEISGSLRKSINEIRLKLQDAFRHRNVQEAQHVTAEAMVVADAAVKIKMANMWLKAVEHRSAGRIRSILSCKIKELESAIIERQDDGSMHKASKRLERCCSGIGDLLTAEKFAEALAKHLSEDMKADLADAIEAYEGALEDGDKSAIKKRGKRLAATIEKAEQDAYFGMISNLM